MCFFNYFTRMANAFNLPVESWTLEFAARSRDTTMCRRQVA